LKTTFNKLSVKHEKFIENHENLCEENKVLKHNFENQNKEFEKVKKKKSYYWLEKGLVTKGRKSNFRWYN